MLVVPTSCSLLYLIIGRYADCFTFGILFFVKITREVVCPDAMASSKSNFELSWSVGRVIKLALFSRAFLLVLMLLWRVLGRPYDTSALLNPPCLSAQKEKEAHLLTDLGGWIGRTLESTIVWDGVYYIRIAECGYEYEQTFAFLPIFPLSIRLIGNTVLSGLIPLVGYRATLALSSYLLNNVAFVLSAIFFHKVSSMILEDEELAFQSTAFFCLNPASIFYASIYSESLFSLLSFAGMWEFLRGSRWKSACLFAISAGVRSNGVLHGGFLLFQAMQEAFKASHHRRFKVAVQIVCVVVVQTAIVLAPFVAFQTFGFLKLCYETRERGIKDSRPWCNKRIPYLYGFVQSHYWDVGFLRYFQVKQLPNFLLASPMLTLAVCSIATYAKYRPRLFFSLGLCVTPAVMPNIKDEDRQHQYRSIRPALTISKDFSLRQRVQNHSQTDRIHTQDENDMSSNMDNTAYNEGGFFSPLSIPFLLEMALMALVACLIMHVQVATRFLSICAPIYWFSAYKIHSYPKNQKLAYVIWGTFIFYVSLGSLLFVNFYPFT